MCPFLFEKQVQWYRELSGVHVVFKIFWIYITTSSYFKIVKILQRNPLTYTLGTRPCEPWIGGSLSGSLQGISVSCWDWQGLRPQRAIGSGRCCKMLRTQADEVAYRADWVEEDLNIWGRCISWWWWRLEWAHVWINVRYPSMEWTMIYYLWDRAKSCWCFPAPNLTVPMSGQVGAVQYFWKKDKKIVGVAIAKLFATPKIWN